MALCNLDGEFIQINKSFCALTGYSIDDLLGKAFVNIIHPDDINTAFTQNTRLLEGEIAQYSVEKRYICKSGDILHVILTVSLLIDEETGDQYYVGQFVDISERRRTKLKIQEQLEELQRANQELDQFAYVVSHDLKAPLRGISTLVNFIQEDLETNKMEEVQKNLQLINGRIVRMNKLINGILEYSRIGKEAEQREKIDIRKLIEEVFEILPPPKKLELELSAQFPIIQANKIGLLQIFQNLISNAIKYNDKEVCRIDIQYKDLGILHRFQISDNGIGIKDAHKEKIFGIFQTLNPRDKVESTGVGLAIVKKRIETLGGTIGLDSIPGQGSHFFFTIPKE